MFVIPGELIALVTFPGTILHEISHRFFCDITNVPVYDIRYFIPLSKTSGCVIHQRTDSLFKAFLIGCGPLIINTIVCMVLMLPYGASYVLQTSFIEPQSVIMKYSLWFVTWLGFCAGVKAIPSNEDVSGLIELSQLRFSQLFIFPLVGLIYIANLDYIGFWVRCAFAMFLTLILPTLFLL